MSINQSDLSDYGFDAVVATTQQSINAQLKSYLYSMKAKGPVVTAYYALDSASGEIHLFADSAALIKELNGTDPLTVKSWNGGAERADIANMDQIVNMYVNGTSSWVKPLYALSFEIGLPGSGPWPDIVQLDDSGQDIIYTLLCKSFTVAAATYTNNDANESMVKYENYSQGSIPWEFKVKVPLAKVMVAQNSNLPGDVSTRAQALGDAFSIQQLLLDLDNLSVWGLPQIEGLLATSPINKLLTTVFLDNYVAGTKTYGQPTLGYSFIPKAPAQTDLQVTDVQLEVENYFNFPMGGDLTADQQKLNTLNYLCAVNGDQPQQPCEFNDPDNYYQDGLPTWNWFDDPTAFHGIVSVSRNAFIDYLQRELHDYVLSNCALPYVKCTTDDAVDANFDTPTLTPGQTPNITVYPGDSNPTYGTRILSYSYTATSHDDCGPNGATGEITLTTTFNLDVYVNTGTKTLTIVQHLVDYLYIRADASKTNPNNNAVDVTIIDTYPIGVDQFGKLQTNRSTNKTDKSVTPQINKIADAFLDVNATIAAIAQWLATASETNLTDLPVSLIQNMIFPGGNTFSFKDFAFSDALDLVSNITYADATYID
jgi:hypothetical protein